MAIVLLALLLGRVAWAEDRTVPEARVAPGVGIGLITLSLELNVETRRWYAGGQLALAAATKNAGGAGYAAIRGGAFLTNGSTAPFVGLGLGALGEADFDAASSYGWGASAEAGIAFRRDEQWFHPQLVLEGILPFHQTKSTTYTWDPGAVVFLGLRLFL